MARGSDLAYQLRPNKAVDRDVFVDFLTHVRAPLSLQRYQYIGMGGPLLEDFRLLGSRLGLRDMVCVEKDSANQRRQRLNCPPFVKLETGDIDEYLSAASLAEAPRIVWLDYTIAARESILQRFAQLVRDAAPESIFKVTFNCFLPPAEAHPPEGPIHQLDAIVRGARQQLGRYAPSKIGRPHVSSRRAFAGTQLEALQLALARELRGSGCEYIPVTAAVYADQATMTTATLITCESGGARELRDRLSLQAWSYLHENWAQPLLIDIPSLSFLERLILEHAVERELAAPPAAATPEAADAAQSSEDSSSRDWTEDLRDALRAGHDFRPPGTLGSEAEVMQSFVRFHRLFPEFARLHR